MRVLELGSYLAPAYAGMILAEQGHEVAKWTVGDPIHELRRGDELWSWVNHGKEVMHREASDVVLLTRAQRIDIVLDNFRADTWKRWGIDPAEEADRLKVSWVSLRADDDGRSFDVVAQARAWGDLGVLPFYLGDTAAGLWMAFKALASPVGHHVIRQATCLAKLVEGEGVAPHSELEPWDMPGTYGYNPWSDTASVEFKGEWVHEPTRDLAWRLQNLPNVGGRFTV